MVLYRHRVVHLCPWRSTSLHLSLSPARARRARDASLQNKSLGWDPLFQFSTACLFLLATDFIQCSSLVELHQVNNLVYISFFSFFWRCAVVLLSYLSSSYSDMNHLNQFILKMICSQNHSVFLEGLWRFTSATPSHDALHDHSGVPNQLCHQRRTWNLTTPSLEPDMASPFINIK